MAVCAISNNGQGDAERRTGPPDCGRPRLTSLPHSINCDMCEKGQRSGWSQTTLPCRIWSPVWIQPVGLGDRTSRAVVDRQNGKNMDTNTLLIIVLVLLVVGGGGFYYRRRV
jgi:hypothetical protein